ncbi:MAG: tetratricopeptide repeat protein [bacterium]|nr:tetratricopeptide repeat protein [bacterium]
MSVDAQSNGGELERLQALGADRPDSPGIASLAEARRRTGDAAAALRLAEEGLASQPELVAARVARALALLDLERPGEARLELERVLEAVPDHPLVRSLQADSSAPATPDPLPELDEAELDDALALAEPEMDQMHSTDSFAAAAIRAAEQEEEPDLVPFEATSDSPYATATVADLLDDQGRGSEAAAIRRGLDSPIAAAPKQESGSVLSTLERWLDTLRRRTG